MSNVMYNLEYMPVYTRAMNEWMFEHPNAFKIEIINNVQTFEHYYFLKIFDETAATMFVLQFLR